MVVPVISKPVERHVASSYMYLKYLTYDGLLYSKHSTYHLRHFRETALLSLTDNCLKAMDNTKLVGSVFLDPSKVFELVSQYILLSKIA